VKSNPEMPMQQYNGLVTSSPRRHAPATDVDHTPRLFRRFVATGLTEVQLNAGVQRRKFTGRRMSIVNYLYAAAPRIPGQTRDNYGGFHRRGIDPLSYQALVDSGPGSQPTNPGGPGKMAGTNFHNPYAMGGG